MLLNFIFFSSWNQSETMKSILCTLFSNALCCANDRAFLEISVAITEALGLSLASAIAIAPDPVPNSKIL